MVVGPYSTASFNNNQIETSNYSQANLIVKNCLDVAKMNDEAEA